MDIFQNNVNKFRHEYKYFANELQLAIIEKRISPIMCKDIHVGVDGKYTIRSVYFDDIYNTCMIENETGIDPREKIRLRVYIDGNNFPSDFAKLECKRKERGKTYKTSVSLNRDEVDDLLCGKIIRRNNYNHSLITKVNTLILTKGLKPKIIVEYDRIPYVYKNGNVRITFDKNIRLSKETKKLLEKDIITRPIMETGNHVLEIKWDEFIPDYIFSSAQIGGLQRTAFSKYYLCRKYALVEGKDEF